MKKISEKALYRDCIFLQKGVITLLAVVAALTLFTVVRSESQLRFSVEPGFYSDSFYLELKGDRRCEIYYTLDGSEPTLNSMRYTEPLFLQDASLKENVYSALDTTTVAFSEELKESKLGFVVPDNKVDKCNIIRAAMFDGRGEKISEIMGSYFVGFENKVGFENIEIVSIVCDPDDLFSYEDGIYVTGKQFDAFREAAKEDPSLKEMFWAWWWGNYYNSGPESERKCHVEIYGSARNTVLSQVCGIRVQGGTTRAYLPKSLGIYAREEYAGSEEFAPVLFSTGRSAHKFVLFSGAGDYQIKILDYLVNSLTKELHFSTMEMRPCAVFLNGEYWGVSHLSENYNADYIKDHYGVEENQVLMVKTNASHEGDGAIEEYRSMCDYIANTDMTLPENYAQAQKLIDIHSFVDYYATEVYIGNYDWPKNNYAAWRSKEVSVGNPYGDCRWRWMLYDVNNFPGDSSDSLKRVIELDGVLASLLRNEEFRRLFADRLQYIGTNVLSAERCAAFIDQYLAERLDSLCLSNDRFYGGEHREGTIAGADRVRRFYAERYSHIQKFIADNLGEEYVN